MKGYELARADIERRGNGDDAASVGKKPSLFAALFRGGKSTEEDDEGGNAPIKNEKSTPASVTTAKSADPVPTPRAKPVGSTIQLASADAQIVSGAKAKPESKPEATQASAEPKPQTPADIINSRGFWDDVPKAANQATPAQVAALRARQALAAATDPQPTASVTESFNKAMAYARAATSPVDRANVVAATAPIPPRPGQQHLDARRDAGAEREQCDVDDRARRYRDDPDAQPLRQAAGRDRHDLLGRSDDGHDLRPLHGIGDRATADAVVRDAHRRAALRRNSHCFRKLVSSLRTREEPQLRSPDGAKRNPGSV
jgi:hypothetical protein